MDSVEEVRTLLPPPASPWTRRVVGMLGRNVPQDSIGIFTATEWRGQINKSLIGDCFHVCNVMNQRIVVAGGAVLAYVEGSSPLTYHNNELCDSRSDFEASDLDVYIRGNCAAECRQTLSDLMAYLEPNSELIVRSKYAVSFYARMSKVFGKYSETYGGIRKYWCNHSFYIKVQVINRPMPRTQKIMQDIEHLFETYDLDCCKWASDGVRIYSTERALEALKTRKVTVRFSRLSDSAIPRMARYYGRCYDFEVENFFGNVAYFPDAIAKIMEIAKSKNRDICDLPCSDYITIGESSVMGGDPMTEMYEAYGRNGTPPHLLCGSAKDVWHLVMGKQPEEYLKMEWCMRIMNKMCETITWMAVSNAEDREIMQKACIGSLQEWVEIMSKIDLSPMYESLVPFGNLSPEVREKYWKSAVRVKIYNVID